MTLLLKKSYILLIGGMSMDFNSLIIEIDIISVIVLSMIWYGNAERAILDKAAHGFQLLVDFSIAFCVLNSLALFIPSTNVPFIRIVNSIKVITCICMGCSWFLSVFYTTSANPYMLRKWLIPIIFPSIIFSGITIVETFMHLNVTPITLHPVVWGLLNVLSVVYISSASALCLTQAKKCTNRFRRRELYVLSFAMILPLFSFFLQAKFYYMPITSPAFVVITLFLYLFKSNQNVTIDITTGLNNTNKFSSYLETITQSQNPAKRLFLVKVEIDNFKAMQKLHGKVTGVIALRKMADFLRKQCSGRGLFIAYYQKATFAIVAECSDFSEIEVFTNRAIAASAENQDFTNGPWPITFSIHWAEYGTSETRTIDALLDKVDKNCLKAATTL